MLDLLKSAGGPRHDPETVADPGAAGIADPKGLIDEQAFAAALNAALDQAESDGTEPRGPRPWIMAATRSAGASWRILSAATSASRSKRI